MATAMEQEILAFFHQYNEAFASLDGDRIAALYHAPAITVRGDGSVHCLRSHEELARFFQGVVDTYHREGSRGSTMHDTEVVAIGQRSALATMTWKMLRADGSLIRQWRQSYNLVRLAEGWRILVATFHLSSEVAQ
jgi:ketosteroid isomerase-like protein